MARIVPWLAVLALIVAGASLAATAGSGRATADHQYVNDHRIDLDCEQTVDPNSNNGIGVVVCSVLIDLPDGLPLPDTIKLIVQATYADLDGNNRPSHGDRLLCIKVSLPNGTVLFQHCRPHEPPPGSGPPGL